MDLNAEIDYPILRSFMYSNESPKEIMEIVKDNKNLRVVNFTKKNAIISE